tara:strand:- start:857 stop:1051 length:195 start_codon:yes stop_codon:yes gene_type:complete
MVFPSIRSFEEISFTQSDKSLQESWKPLKKDYKSNAQGPSLSWKKRSKRSLGKFNRDFQYPIAS